MYAEQIELQTSRFLLVVIGPPGVGKTAFTYELQERIPYCQIVSKDEIASRYLHGRHLYTPEDEAYYLERYRGPIYAQARREIDCLLFFGPVVFDVTHRLERENEGWENPYREIAEMHGIPLFCIELYTPQEILWQRLEQRPIQPAFYDLSTKTGRLRFVQDWLTNPSKLPADCGREIDNSGSLSVAVNQALTFITSFALPQ